MKKERLEAYTDAVLAILITLMVLEIHAPEHQFTWEALYLLLPQFAIYGFSFFVIGTFWVNHYNLFRKVKLIGNRLLWRNNLNLFIISFIPFSTSWLLEGAMHRAPESFYGLVLLLSNLSYLGILHSLRFDIENPEVHNQRIIGLQALVWNIIALVIGQFIPIATLLINFISLCALWIIRAMIQRKLLLKKQFFTYLDRHHISAKALRHYIEKHIHE